MMNGSSAGGIMLVLQVLMAMVLAWSCLCRATKTNGDTRREVRWAMTFEGVAVGLLGGAPFLPVLMPADTQAIANYFHTAWPPGHTPLAIWILFLVSIFGVQLATAKYWRDGVPRQLQVRRMAEEPPEPPALRVVAAGGLVAMFVTVVASGAAAGMGL